MAKKPITKAVANTKPKKAKKIVTASGATVVDPEEVRARTTKPRWAK